jgi:mannose-6-phosphate isomerase-like protein (cupin superfamily)
MEAKNVVAELDKHAEGTFLDVVPFNQTNIGACSIAGESPVWEMHPDTDEFFHVLDGQLEITLLEDNGTNTYPIPTGSVFVVPKGIWHKPSSPNGVKFVYLTPGQTLHSSAEDPRNSNA